MQPAIGYEHQRARDKLKASSPSTNTCMYKQLLHATVAAIRGFLTLKTQIFSFFLLSLHLFNFFFCVFLVLIWAVISNAYLHKTLERTARQWLRVLRLWQRLPHPSCAIIATRIDGRYNILYQTNQMSTAFLIITHWQSCCNEVFFYLFLFMSNLHHWRTDHCLSGSICLCLYYFFFRISRS